MATSKPQGTFHDAITGETITRDLTAEDIAELLKSTEDEE
jgi:hypothetical protein